MVGKMEGMLLVLSSGDGARRDSGCSNPACQLEHDYFLLKNSSKGGDNLCLPFLIPPPLLAEGPGDQVTGKQTSHFIECPMRLSAWNDLWESR